ncbi:MAG: RsmD family RNA methyltransferase [Bacteroidota bacterium]
MRIISGSHKGRRLMAPRNLPVRPTTDNAKEALFNILNHQYYFDELQVLDLFAGTGNISFEFASRGTPKITAVDSFYGCVAYIQKIANEFNFPITALKRDVFKFLESHSQTYDVIFADPPYAMEIDTFETLVNLVFNGELLQPEGVLIVEHPKHTDLSHLRNHQESRRYGSSVFSFFGMGEDPS